MKEGKRMLHLCLAKMGGRERHYVDEAFDTNWVAPLGPNVDAFEKELEKYLGAGRPVAALSAGTAAVHLALLLLGVKPGDEVICQSWTFAATANPIVYLGARPVFVDSEEETWNMSPSLLRKAVTDRIATTGRKPKAIVVAEMYGMPAQMDPIMEIAGEFDIPVVEDAAEALGSDYKGRKCGTIGNFGVLSFNGNKMITTSGGGALVCPDEESKRRALYYATQAREPLPYYEHLDIGYNYRMSNICAGIGRGQMEVLEEHLAHHRMLARTYRRLFAEVDGIDVKDNPSADYNSNFWLTTIIIDSNVTGCTAEELRRHLASVNVESRPLWKPMHMQPVYREAPAYVNGVSERLFPLGLCLPSGPWITNDDAAFIVDEIKRFINVALHKK